jgi:DegV family protein with EDD domain
MAPQEISIVTDSVCDLPRETVERWNIGVVPIFVNFGDKSLADDGQELDRDHFARTVLEINPPPTTAAPPPIYAERVIGEALKTADHVIAIVAPARYSGIYNAFRLATQSFPAGRVTLVDSGQISLGMGFQVVIAAETARATGDLTETLAVIERVRKNTVIYAAGATLDQLRRSGRVGWAGANLGALLQIKPVIKVFDGLIEAADRVRTFKRALDRIAELTHEHAPFDRAALLHLHNDAGRDELETRLKDILPEETLRLPAGVALSVHLGPGAVGFAGVSQAWKN